MQVLSFEVYLHSLKQMVVVAQLVRASVCGAEGRGFEPHHPPFLKALQKCEAFFISVFFICTHSKYIFFSIFE